MRKRIVFDLDETLGVPLIDGSSMVNFRLRQGCADLLHTLSEEYTLLLWTVSSRRYVEKALSFGLASFFDEVYTWDEIASEWKDIRKIRADYLIDDRPHHQEQALSRGLTVG